MRNLRSSNNIAIALALGLGLCLVGATIAAAQPAEQPHRYLPRSFDGALVNVVAPDGTVWSAWAYRSGAEYDIAISAREPGGFWSEPTFIGQGDRRDQVQPALAADGSQTLYLAYTDRSTGAIMVSALRLGASEWLAPVSVTGDGERGQTPALSVVADRLVVAFRSGREVAIRTLPLLAPETQTGGSIQDGFDPFGREHDTGGGSGGGGSQGGGGGGSSGGGGGSQSGASGGIWPSRDSGSDSGGGDS